MTGAQLMAAAVVSEGCISYGGRWVSKQMLRYAREALLARTDLGVTAGLAGKEGRKGRPSSARR